MQADLRHAHVFDRLAEGVFIIGKWREGEVNALKRDT